LKQPRAALSPGKKMEKRVMTRVYTNIESERPVLNNTVVGVFSTAVLVLAGLLSFFAFATV
jgi:hypothetical protein